MLWTFLPSGIWRSIDWHLSDDVSEHPVAFFSKSIEERRRQQAPIQHLYFYANLYGAISHRTAAPTTDVVTQACFLPRELEVVPCLLFPVVMKLI